MALVLKDRVKETSNTAGTGTITLAGAVAGFQSFSAVGNGNTTYYAIVDPTTGDWEVGVGTYTSSGTTLSRDTVLSSSNSGSLVSFAANQKDVFVTYPSEKSVYEDASNVVNATSFGAITATSAALTTGTVSTAPASGTDIANKTYVDTLVSSGITYHTPVKYEVPDSTGNLNATYNQPGGPGVGVGATLTNAGTLVAFTPDGTVATAGDRIIVYNQTNQFENGIYTVTTVGSGSVAWVLTRATDADTYALKSPNGLGNGDAFFITSGATGAGETYVCNTAGAITFGTTAITFAQISDSTLYTAGTGLTLTGTEFSITPTGTAGTYGSASSVPVLTTNASGQVTSVTNTTIAINGSQVSGNISGSAGSVANSLTLGTYLTGGAYNGSAAVTATVDATSANTASKVVARDSSGNFSAGTITATLNGTATSTASATNLSGGAANQIAYQSAANTTAFATAPSASNQVLNWNGSAFTWSAGTISGVPLGSNLNSLTAGTYLTGTAYNGSAAQTWTVDATSANTASKVVARDASGNFSAGTITAALTGNVTGTASGNLPLSGGLVSGSILTETAASSWGVYSKTTGYSNESGIWFSSNVGELLLRNSAGSLVTRIAADGSYAYINNSNILLANNYNSYAPTLTGTGASGTWNINVTGSAGSASSVAWGNITSKPSNIMFYEGFTLDANTMSTNSTGFTYANNAPAVGPIARFSAGGSYDMWLNAPYSGGGSTLYFRTRNGDTYSYNSWQALASYGINYASTLYATTYYDANDSAYFVDPTSTSVISTLRAGTIQHSNSNTAIVLNSASYLQLLDPSGSVRAYLGNSNDPANYYDNTTHYFRNNSSVVKFTINDSYGQHVSSLRAPIFYDSDNPAYYVDPASISNLVTVNTQNAVSNITGGLRNVMPGGGAYTTGASTVSGAIVVRLPTNLYPMIRFTVKVYTYDGLSFDINCGGHTSSGTWYNTFAWMATQYRSAMNVRFTYDGTYVYVYIGDLGSSWSYPQVFITDVQVGYSVTDYSYWDDGWSISFNTSTYNSISATHTVYPPTSTGNNTNPAYASIYYDANDTSYYVDPNSNSRLVNLGLGGVTPDVRLSVSGDVHLSSNLYLGGTAGSAGSWSGRMYSSGGATYINTSTFTVDRTGYGGSGSFSMDTSGNSYASASFRAPIFYDSDNPAYYGDFASTSRMNALSLDTVAVTSGITGLTSAPITTQYANAGGTNTWYPMTYQRAQHSGGYITHLNTGLYKLASGWGAGDTGWYAAIGGNDSYPTQAWYLTYDGYIQNSLGYVQTSFSFRAPIFYDLDNTGYYVNPAGTSQFSRVEANYSIEMRSSAGGGYPAFLVNQYADVSIYRANNATAYIGFSADGLAYLYNDGTNFIFSGRGLQATSFGVGTAPSGTTGEIRATNNITAYYSSDIKFKTNVRDIPNAIETVESIGGKLFDWNDEYIEEHGGEDGYFIQKEDFGVIAQDVLKVFPVAVRTRPDGSLAVDYEKLSALAFAAVSELSTRVKSLEARI